MYHVAMLTTRQRLRAEVFQLADDRCEHPAEHGRCENHAVEMAHIVPRGMGHTGYRDTLDNVMATCRIHARSTDDLTSPEWDHVHGWQFYPDCNIDTLMTKRQSLANYVNRRRRDG